MSLKAYKAGMECPPLAPGKLRIYCMRFCPFCARALLVLHAKNIPHEVVNIDLQNKPEWHLKLHPAGKVPLLQQDDKVVCESLIVSEYLDEAYGKTKLLPTDPYLKARDKMFVEVGSSLMMPMLKIRLPNEPRVELWEQFKSKLSVYEEELETRRTIFFSGTKPGFVDYMVWPFFRSALAYAEIFPELEMPTSKEMPLLLQWIEAMKKDEACAALVDQSLLVEYFKGVQGGKIDYDVGL